MRRAALALSAALAGAAGLAVENLLLDSAGLALGHGRSTAIGLPTFLAAWGLGAFRSGRSGAEPRKALIRTGVFCALLAWPAVAIVLWGGRVPGSFVASVAAVTAIAVAGFAFGGFLAPLARASGGDVGWLFAANLAGAVAGTWWIADRVVADFGRLAAAAAAGGLAALAGAIGGVASGRGSARVERSVVASGEIDWGAAAVIVATATAWVASLEWIGLRLGVLWLGGMQPALRAVLAASLIALALGAAILPKLVPRGAGGVVATLAACSIASLWPFAAGSVLSRATLDNDLATALVLVGPALFPFGAVLPVLHRALPLESGERLGRLLLHESWGAFLGVPLVELVLVPRFGLGAALAWLQVFGVVAIIALVRARPRGTIAVAAASAACALLASSLAPPALRSPPLSNPAFSIRSFAEDRDFAVTVVDDGLQGERTLLTDGFRAAGTGRDYRYMRVLGHLPILLAPSPRRVAVLALGTGTTLGAVSLHPEVERIDVLEISSAVVEAAPYFLEKNHGVLASDPRVAVRLGDGRATLARERGTYDVITMEPLLPDSPFGVYLYTREFYERARGALAPGGLLCQWVPAHALEPASFAAVLGAFGEAFPWSSQWVFGTQVILVGGEACPELDARRFAASGGLADDLAALGLESPAGLAARYVSVGRGNDSSRALTDSDPWIVYRPRRKGAALLGDLPTNLGSLRGLATPVPEIWTRGLGGGELGRIAGVAAVRDAREAHARQEAKLRGWRDDGLRAPTLEGSLERARTLAPGDPELLDLQGEIDFLADLRAGVAALASRSSAADALAALRSADRARPERGDVRLYLALALERVGDAGASAALERALDACPGIARTPVGERCRALGLSDRAWSAALARAAEARHDLFRKEPFPRASGAATPGSP